jgi:16S rRNA G966 N2-methylase RsmD
MIELERLEKRLLELTGRFDLRPTLERAADIGDLLLEARSLLKHGEWAEWLSRVGLHRRTAWDYLSVAKARIANVWPATDLPMTIKGFLRYVRRANHAEREVERQAARDEARRRRGDLPDNIVLAHADCKEFGWPGSVNLVVADPPWSDMTLYEWLAGFAEQHLQDGGILLAECGQDKMMDVMGILSQKLTYIWTLALVYAQARHVLANGRFRVSWRPVLLYGKGHIRPEALSDTYLIDGIGTEKRFHEWEQPAKPWKYWLSRLVPPGSLVADPFAGSGVIGVVCHELGLRYIGTECDRKTFRVARGRLLKATQGTAAKEPATGY